MMQTKIPLLNHKGIIMKYKTFRYNQIIKFFLDNNMPLTRQQVELIASKVREEVDARDKRIEKRSIKRIKRSRTNSETNTNSVI
jgi:hypothetical protein